MRVFFFLVILLITTTSYGKTAKFYLEKPNELGSISTKYQADLCQVAKHTQRYLENYRDDVFAVHAGKEVNKSITLNRVKNTLAFLCQIQQQDTKLKQTSRLANQEFLLQHFDFLRWFPDKETANNIADKSKNTIKKRLLNNIPQQKILLTKYYTKLLEGSVVKTTKYNQALYALPYDEQSYDGQQLTLEQAELKKNQLTRYQYTRQQVIAGALLKNKGNKPLAKPLIWLTESALHDVLLQGTGVFFVDDKDTGDKVRYFNVHRNNGIAYNYSIGKTAQARYWYFIETPEIMGYGNTQQSKIAIKPQVTVAGNVADIGLGKLFMINYKSNGLNTSRMAILADHGGAFDDNLFQLDLLVNSYKGWKDYYQENKHLPDYATAWLMLVKE